MARAMTEQGGTQGGRVRASVLVGLAACALFALGLPFGLPSLKTVVCADRVLAGEVPYRDFWTMYAPGSFYAVAGAFLLLGRELWVQSLLCCAVLGAAAAVFFDLLSEQGVPRRRALLLAAAFVLMLWAPSPEWASYPSALLALLLAVRLALPRLLGRGMGRVFLAGALLGVAAWFKHDVAFHGALALGLALELGRLLPGSEGAERGPGAPFAALLRLAAGALATALPVALLLALTAGRDAWQDLIVFPATVFPQVFGDPYPSWLPPLAPLGRWLRDTGDLRLGQAAFGALAGWAVCIVPHAFFWGGLALLFTRGRAWPRASRAAVLLWLLWLPPFWAAAHVQQNTHVWSMGLACLALFALVRGQLARAGPALRVAVLVPTLLLVLGHALRPAMTVFLLATEFPESRWLDLPGASFTRVSAEEAEVLRPITAFVRRHVPAGEPIYVGVQRHDAIVISNQRFYYLAERPSATRYNELHPGVTDRETVQREMIADLEARGVRCAVLWRFGWSREQLDRIRERRRALVPDAGSALLDAWLAREFEELERHGQYSLLWRRGAPRPAGD